jgi:hypothetical protein
MRLLALIALLALALTACASDTSTGAVAPTVDQARAGPVLGDLTFKGFELGFQPGSAQVEQPGRYAVTFTNTGQMGWISSAHCQGMPLPGCAAASRSPALRAGECGRGHSEHGSAQDIFEVFEDTPWGVAEG